MRRSLLVKTLALASLALMALVIGCGSDTALITFVSEVDGDAEIFVMNRDGTGPNVHIYMGHRVRSSPRTHPAFATRWASVV